MVVEQEPRCAGLKSGEKPMHPMLTEFLDKWIWPTAPGAPGAAFRLRITDEKCVKGWEMALASSLAEIEKGLASGNDEWKRRIAMGGYAAEGVQMSIKQMSAQLLSIDIAEQEQYLDLQRMRARQVWDECKHSKLHAEVLMEKGWIGSERDLLENAAAHTQPLPAYFGLSMMFPHIHPLARAAQHYFVEAIACIGIAAYLSRVDDPMVRHEHLSQRDEELMHLMEGKYIIDTYCGGPRDQQAVEETLEFLLHRLRVSL
jgi:hypothetical protein